jgi:isoleucyl-tRNA synthetase
MPFREVPNKVDFPTQERELLQFWKESGAFQQLRLLHKNDPHWSFIDGQQPHGGASRLGAHL